MDLRIPLLEKVGSQGEKGAASCYRWQLVNGRSGAVLATEL